MRAFTLALKINATYFYKYLRTLTIIIILTGSPLVPSCPRSPLIPGGPCSPGLPAGPGGPGGPIIWKKISHLIEVNNVRKINKTIKKIIYHFSSVHFKSPVALMRNNQNFNKINL